MKVAITTKKELQDPHLEFDINLEKGTFAIRLTYTCNRCAGYGCHSQACDDSVILQPEQVVPTLGEDARDLLHELFDKILNIPKPKSSEKKSYLVCSEEPDKNWAHSLHKLAVTIPGEILVRNVLKASNVAVVDASDLGVDYLRENGFKVEANGTKRAISE